MTNLLEKSNADTAPAEMGIRQILVMMESIPTVNMEDWAQEGNGKLLYKPLPKAPPWPTTPTGQIIPYNELTKFDPSSGEYVTNDGKFRIKLLHGNTVVRENTAGRATVDVETIESNDRSAAWRLRNAIFNAKQQAWGGLDALYRLHGLPHDPRKADVWEAIQAGKRVRLHKWEVVEADAATDGFWKRIETRLFNILVRPKEVIPRYYINKIAICTPGNLTTASGAIKSGKSSFVEAMIAAAITPNKIDADFRWRRKHFFQSCL